MILINLKMPIRPERVEEFIAIAQQYRADVMAEPGNVFFEWSRDLQDPNTFIATECFTDGAAGGAHMSTGHVATFMEIGPDYVAAQPDIIYVDSEMVTGWNAMGEIKPR
ncbi:MAG TPA: putative quinol monooxygenase [Sporichthyaceae bacterium]|jgi:quinol monooxygenase YgiN